MKKLFLSVFASVTALSAMAGGHDAWWKTAGQPYKGVTLQGVTENTPPGQFVSEVLAKDFEELTGNQSQAGNNILGPDVRQGHQGHGGQYRYL